MLPSVISGLVTRSPELCCERKPWKFGDSITVSRSLLPEPALACMLHDNCWEGWAQPITLAVQTSWANMGENLQKTENKISEQKQKDYYLTFSSTSPVSILLQTNRINKTNIIRKKKTESTI